jgi:hypothetical protein
VSKQPGISPDQACRYGRRFRVFFLSCSRDGIPCWNWVLILIEAIEARLAMSVTPLIGSLLNARKMVPLVHADSRHRRVPFLPIAASKPDLPVSHLGKMERQTARSLSMRYPLLQVTGCNPHSMVTRKSRERTESVASYKLQAGLDGHEEIARTNRISCKLHARLNGNE